MSKSKSESKNYNEIKCKDYEITDNNYDLCKCEMKRRLCAQARNLCCIGCQNFLNCGNVCYKLEED
jgi:hypothetical protein